MQNRDSLFRHATFKNISKTQDLLNEAWQTWIAMHRNKSLINNSSSETCNEFSHSRIAKQQEEKIVQTCTENEKRNKKRLIRNVEISIVAWSYWEGSRDNKKVLLHWNGEKCNEDNEEKCQKIQEKNVELPQTANVD